jgi:hypothetical protein
MSDFEQGELIMHILQHFAIVMAAYFALSAFFRLLGTLCSSFDIASRMASFLITMMVLYRWVKALCAAWTSGCLRKVAFAGLDGSSH